MKLIRRGRTRPRVEALEERALLASAGALDATFGAGGFAIQQTGAFSARINAAVVQKDGSIIAVGQTQAQQGAGTEWLVEKFLPNGSPDTSFGTSGNGQVVTDFGTSDQSATAVLVQPDGKIVVAGVSGGQVALARYDSKGNLDTTFNGGEVTDALASLDNPTGLSLDGNQILVVATVNNAAPTPFWSPA